MRRALVLVLCSIGGLLACGDDDGGGGGSASPIAAEELCGEYLDLLCTADQSCCTTPRFASQAECVADGMPECQSSIAQLAMDARTGYDASTAGRELASLGSSARRCDPGIVEAARDFTSFFRGTVDEGGDCSLASLMDIAPVLSCRQPLACRLRLSGTMVTGTCQQKVGTGAECAADNECEDDLRCDKPASDAVGACGPRLTLGSACDEERDCQSSLCRESVCVAATQETVYCEDDSSM